MSAARVIQPQVSRPVGYRALLPTSTSQAAASKVFARSLAAGNRWNAKVHEAMGQYCAIRALQSGNSAIFALSPFYGMSADYHQRMASRCRNIVDKLDQ